MAIGLAFVASFVLFRDAHSNGKSIGKTVAKALVERIIIAESNGDPNSRNKRSSATGAAQFLDDAWLEAVRKHRRDLIQGRSDKEVLDLRRDPELAREIAVRLLKEYAAMLNKRDLPITPGSLYLAHFAGPAGAVALLSSAENAEAASLMAAADATARTTREKLVKANPFLHVLTVDGIRSGPIARWQQNSPGHLEKERFARLLIEQYWSKAAIMSFFADSGLEVPEFVADLPAWPGPSCLF
ncbi:transglycosylase SLT domain-containing protein [Nitrobacter hamburgensis]|uniref:transglycosylase SLT domain-containing protein n=1 Tax=Nitrobacter hamburgensis TaxID=912 RepID=UPI000303EFD0|nr:transglycosylase SLT domain-containing protein [Nitrobacter hamburgensis]